MTGLTDQNMALMLGMREMSPLDEAKLALERYLDLKGDSRRIRAVNAAPQRDAGHSMSLSKPSKG